MRQPTHPRGLSDPKRPRRFLWPHYPGSGTIYQLTCSQCHTTFLWDAISDEAVLLHPISRLSRLQKRILGELERLDKWVLGGISIKRLRQGEVKTAASNAAFSRTLVQLEKRGLVTRTNRRAQLSSLRTETDHPLKRTTHVRLTRLGRKVARWLRQVSGNGAKSPELAAISG